MNRTQAWMLTGLLAAATLAVGCEPQGRVRYTLLLTKIANAGYHVEWSEQLLERTQQETGWDGLYVVHSAGVSDLYWGKYVTREQAAARMRTVARYRTDDGRVIFRNPAVMTLQPDDIGPPEQKLLNSDGYWTLVVAEFTDVPGRDITHEEWSAAYCQELRDQGYEAYFHHDALKSYVTIGSFPENAYELRYPENVPEVWVPTVMDPILADLLEVFPNLAINGREEIRESFNTITLRDEKFTAPTYIWAIPERPLDTGDMYEAYDAADPVGDW